MLAIGLVALIILQYTLPGELVVQAIICGIVFGIVVIYWIGYASWQSYMAKRGKRKIETWLPPYDWEMMFWGISLIGLSVVLFSSQQVYPGLTWASHSLWHMTSALGFHYLWQIKKPAEKYANVASRMNTRYATHFA